MNQEPIIIIREGRIEECLEITSKIPELSDGQYGFEEYKKRLLNAKNLILIATINDELVGFKVGYERDSDNSFYSWMGGVLPEFRKLKIAQQLADYQQIWARNQGYESITFKTRNYLKPMLIFSLKNGFHIESIEPREKLEDYRIFLRKLI
jgi:predicted GNAT superfamily acetyltransferase